VSLALTGGEGVKKINELLEKHLWVLNADERASVLTGLTLNALLGPKGELSSGLEGRIVVAPRELIKALKDEMDRGLLPALRVTFGFVKPEDVGWVHKSIKDSTEKEIYMYAVWVANGDGAAVEWLRRKLIDGFLKKSGLFKEFGVNVDKLFDEFMELVGGLDGKYLQVLAPGSSRARLALMLYVLINGDEKLAKAYALSGAVILPDKLPTRLFLDFYRACEKGCELSNEDLRQAITKLFLYHI